MSNQLLPRQLENLQGSAPKLNFVHFSQNVRQFWWLQNDRWLTDRFDSKLTWIQQTASLRILIIARKFLKARIIVGLMPLPPPRSLPVSLWIGRLTNDFYFWREAVLTPTSWHDVSDRDSNRRSQDWFCMQLNTPSFICDTWIGVATEMCMVWAQASSVYCSVCD